MLDGLSMNNRLFIFDVPKCLDLASELLQQRLTERFVSN
jgi:hypothetical protein